jgi:hypothetical protein
MNRFQYPPNLTGHPRIAAAIFAVVLSFAGVANTHAMSLFRAHKAKRGRLTIVTSTEVNGAILEPGEYEVRETNSPSGPVIEFVRPPQFANDLVQPAQVVVRLKFAEQPLSTKARETQLMLASWYSTDAIGVEIRGNAVGYVFKPAQLAAQEDTTVVISATGGATNDTGGGHE